MNPPPTGGSIISTISGPLFVKQLVHGLVRKSEDYVTFLNTFVLVLCSLYFVLCTLYFVLCTLFFVLYSLLYALRSYIHIHPNQSAVILLLYQELVIRYCLDIQLCAVLCLRKFFAPDHSP